jgi:ribosomal protein S18 acetylase RimI-like enzyme
MEFTIRRAKIDDAGAIAHVHVESWRSTYVQIVPNAYLASLNAEARSPFWQKQIEAGLSLTFVAESESGVVGFASAGRLREVTGSYDAELYAIYLLREFQRSGAGRALVRTVVDSLRAEGFKGMAVWVLERNPAVSFYKKLGGIQVAAKSIEIGGVSLEEVALGWPDLDALARSF